MQHYKNFFKILELILTKETHKEQESFFKLFNNCVDEVTVTQYSERGGNIKDLNKSSQQAYEKVCNSLNIPKGAPYLRDSEGNISVANYRIPCEQPYQRMLVTYDGRVSMCCYDWGAMHPIGYVSDACFSDEDADKKLVMQRVNDKRKGFELLQEVKFPPKFNQPIKKVQTLNEIWIGQEIGSVRESHGCGQIDKVDICKKCPFKDTYNWVS